jgi:predicted DNA-binding transcriptional regulator AlpA
MTSRDDEDETLKKSRNLFNPPLGGFSFGRNKMPKLIYMSDLQRYDIKFSAGHVRRLIKAGKFPMPSKMGDSRNSHLVWTESDILAWRNDIIARRLKPAA